MWPMDAKQHDGGGSHATGSYNQAGDLTGPDSSAVNLAAVEAGEGQGDDLANRLGGGEGGGSGMSGGGAATGSAEAGRSEGGGGASGYTPSAGAPGGMGGVGGAGKAPGGVSPIPKDDDC
jgi:hypothetical protein